MVIYNPSARVKGDVTSLDPLETKQALEITCYGAFLVAQQAAIRMVKQGSGSIFFTGASAGVKGFPNSSAFAMGKFGLRGLAQSLARELHPKNIHIAHFVIDGGIASKERPNGVKESFLEPDEIASTYLSFHRQKRSAWAWEIELRPWVEKFNFSHSTTRCLGSLEFPNSANVFLFLDPDESFKVCWGHVF